MISVKTGYLVEIKNKKIVEIYFSNLSSNLSDYD